MATTIPWQCPCGNVIQLAKWQIEGTRPRKVCGTMCPARACFYGGVSAGGRVVQRQRIQRVMFTYGCTESEARYFMKGCRRGSQATAYRLRKARLRNLARSGGPRVGSAEWEARSK